MTIKLIFKKNWPYLINYKTRLSENNWSKFVCFTYKAADYELYDNICFSSVKICRR